MQLQTRIVNGERLIGSETDGPVHGLNALFEQYVVVIEPAPALAIEGIGNIELRARILTARVGAAPFVARGPKLLAMKHLEGVFELFLIDLVGAGNYLGVGSHLAKRAGLRRVDPYNKSGIDNSPQDPP